MLITLHVHSGQCCIERVRASHTLGYRNDVCILHAWTRISEIFVAVICAKIWDSLNPECRVLYLHVAAVNVQNHDHVIMNAWF